MREYYVKFNDGNGLKFSASDWLIEDGNYMFSRDGMVTLFIPLTSVLYLQRII